MTITRRGILGAATVPALLALPRAARAQAWPDRPVRVIVPYAPGGGTDVTTRAIGELLSHTLGQNFVVENRAGANGVVGTEAVARAAPDGYTFVAATSTHIMNRQIVPRLAYHPVNDFTPVALLARYPLVLVTGPGSEFASVADLIRAAKARPGTIAQATADAQTSFTANNLAKRAGVEMVEVPYRGSGAYLADLTGGHIPVAWASTATVMPLRAAGTVKVLAISAPQRSRFLPDVPTLRESGVEGADFIGWFGLFGPARLPPAVASRLNDAINAAFGEAVMKQRLDSLAVDAAPMGLDALAELMRQEDARWELAARENLLPRG
ncbi:tripartite tricarboxylate transporter substrate binding protein [Roseomonas nepalensis]|uniref:Tripartite tricarboxylate transporter substrate binding protein n=1 Tax=Muricoccus nepalensis TaxID=1854500 RepID=A0A502GCR3_9PROT|nr:tripartite tricarboxylate transporter substrate-binding protein [Roseomonas nepalensis]TPG59725.1 tripartite tricarboxylate transporter substrate binding protein [Roseomonas nepalensis]